MKTIFRSLFVIAAVAAVAGGATYAWLSSSASITGTTFSAGTMNLKVDRNPHSAEQDWVTTFSVARSEYESYLENGLPGGSIDYDNFIAALGLKGLKPGDVKSQVIDIKNEGSVDGNATIKLQRTSAWSNLFDKMVVKVYYNGSSTPAVQGEMDQYTGEYNLGSLPAEQVGNVKIEWSVPGSVGNEIQGDEVTANVVFGLNQVQQ